ncbi:NucA/NucB deoxyribonuclease domain-containing protein [Streptomyces massasporeus]|uniref:NucA/NucB deoxyribonuclease domain-containing protein n=1 Tax=Streptomyces massasporeus TaxID=67324 RepID=UPI00340EBC40
MAHPFVLLRPGHERHGGRRQPRLRRAVQAPDHILDQGRQGDPRQHLERKLAPTAPELDQLRRCCSRGGADEPERQGRSLRGLNRPSDSYQCDEFPFASTKEGAGLGDGNFSVRYVPGTENSKAGSELADWYGSDRILHNNAYGIHVK